MGNIHLKNKIFSREKGFFKVYLIHLDISQDKSFAENYSVKKLCCSARQPLPHRNRVKSFLVLQPGVVVIQLLSPAWLFVTPWTAAHQASLFFAISRSLLELMSIESVMPSNHLVHCHPLLLLPSIFPSIRVFSKKLAVCIRWPKYWSFNFSISSSNEYSGVISFRIDRFDLLAVQGSLKSLLQCHSSKASILQHSAFCMVQLSHPSMTAGKTI